MESVSENDFRDTLARWPSGVTVVTARAGDTPIGITVASFSSLSLDPPLVLVCIARSAQSHDGLVGAPGFAIHVLGGVAGRRCRRASPRPGADKFGALRGRARPLRGAAAALRRRPPGVRGATPRIDGGDHTILVGRVVSVEHAGTDPLLYCNRAYGRLSPSV